MKRPPGKFEHIQEQLGGFEAGAVLYDIYAMAEPRGELARIGALRLRSPFRWSKWWDEEHFVRHDWFEQDLFLRPDWKAAVDGPDFWYEEGANNFYSSIDPGQKADPGMGHNAWIGGYNPASV